MEGSSCSCLFYKHCCHSSGGSDGEHSGSHSRRAWQYAFKEKSHSCNELCQVLLFPLKSGPLFHAPLAPERRKHAKYSKVALQPHCFWARIPASLVSPGACPFQWTVASRLCHGVWDWSPILSVGHGIVPLQLYLTAPVREEGLGHKEEGEREISSLHSELKEHGLVENMPKMPLPTSFVMLRLNLALQNYSNVSHLLLFQTQYSNSKQECIDLSLIKLYLCNFNLFLIQHSEYCQT